MQNIEHRLIVRASIDGFSRKTNELSSLFYTHLFRINPDLIEIFHGGVPMINRKFSSMIATFKNIKDLEKISSALEAMAKRHIQYHAEMAHFPQFKESLMLALHDLLGRDFTPELQAAWEKVFDEVAAIMREVFAKYPQASTHKKGSQNHESHLIDEIESIETITAIHQRFYDEMYDDPYLSQFFAHRAKYLVVRKQTEFMVAAFGGENHYKGEPPAFIHMHMFITKEMSDIREVYLRRAILGEGLSESICERWLDIDRNFHASIEKETSDECVMRCMGQQPFTIQKPLGYFPPKR
ncbi:MAG: hypothetical protein Q9M28_09305 [Mariprofundaceae bacterium]|nr:hypothetical protein [Mariprofundaceae bacterium]